LIHFYKRKSVCDSSIDMHIPGLTGDLLKLYNVILLGISFCLVFAGFNTMNAIQTLVYESAKDPDSGGYVEGYSGNGLWSLAVIYMAFTFSNVISPSLVALMGPRVTLFVGAWTYVLFTAQLVILQTELLYITAAIVGLGSAITWTAQGNFLALNSDEKTITRNSGIFWALFASSGFLGNIFVYFKFAGQSSIDAETRTFVGALLIGLSSLGALTIGLLRPAPKQTTDSTNDRGVIQALKESGKLFITRDMLLLSFTFFFTGIQLNIWSAVYATCIGFTHGFGESRKGLATISGMFVSFGEVIGGLVFGIFGNRFVKKGKWPVVVAGCLVTLLAYAFAFINLPKEAPMGETTPDQTSIIESNKYLAITTSFLLGLSDACFNTQILALLGGSFKSQSVSAFAIWKFMQALASSIAFWYSPLLNLYWHLLIATIFAVIGTATFCFVEWDKTRQSRNTEDNTTSAKQT